MTEQDQHQTPEQPHVVETASGTTSPDNARSGNLAYFIGAAGLAASLAMGSCGAGCMSLMGNIAADEFSSHSYYSQRVDDQMDDLFDDREDLVEDLLNDREDNGSYGHGTNTNEGTQGTSTVRDVLGTDLAIYNVTIDAQLAASDYANAQAPVSSFVRELVLVDRNASSEITEILRTAAWGDGSLDDALAKASEKATQTAESLRALELPKAEGEHAADISRNLETGRTKAIERWTAVSSELELLSKGEEVDLAELMNAEDAVGGTTIEAATSLSSALTDSAKR